MQGHLDKNKYCYYKLNQDVDFSIKTDCECVSSRPNISNIHQLIWTVLSLGLYRRYELIVRGEIVSTAEEMSKMPFKPQFGYKKSRWCHVC